jgi:hypothetical protein
VRYYWTPGGVLEDEGGNLVMLDDHLAALAEARREEREARDMLSDIAHCRISRNTVGMYAIKLHVKPDTWHSGDTLGEAIRKAHPVWQEAIKDIRAREEGE